MSRSSAREYWCRRDVSGRQVSSISQNTVRHHPKPKHRAGAEDPFVSYLAAARVRTIAPLSFRRTNAGIVPTDLVLPFPSVDVDLWRAWADDFIVKGNNGQNKEKQGAIEVMAPNHDDVLVTLTIKQIGIFALTPTDDTSIRSHRASMYFEHAQLSIP